MQRFSLDDHEPRVRLAQGTDGNARVKLLWSQCLPSIRPEALESLINANRAIAPGGLQPNLSYISDDSC